MTGRSSNPHLALWVAASGLSHGEIARRIAAEAVRRGHRQITPDATRIRRWVDGERPRPPVPALLAAVLSEAVGQPLTPGDLGLTAAGAVLDTIALPLLTEAAAQTLAGWTQMDLFLDRRDTLKLALGAPLILAAERMLGGTAHAMGHGTKGFDADTAAALEEVTAFFTTADAARGGGLYRSAIVAQLAEAARRIENGVPPSLKTRVFAATADLAALGGWVSHDSGRYATAQRYWAYGIYAAGEAGQRDRGVEIVTRMSHQMIYLGHPRDALGLLGVAAKKATLPATRALVASQTGRVHAALGDERSAERHLGAADDLVADGLGDAPDWVAYFDAATSPMPSPCANPASTGSRSWTISAWPPPSSTRAKPSKAPPRPSRPSTRPRASTPPSSPPASTPCWPPPARTAPPRWRTSAPGRQISQLPVRRRSRPESIASMGKHSRPGPPNQLSRAVPRLDADDQLAAYNKRRRPPLDIYRRHRPFHGGASHLRPDEPRALEQWDGFSFAPAGTAADLAAAQQWVNEVNLTRP
ncbi:DUF6087 family protein [Streptomyces olivoreticuli]|uniref:DUF6087 family protein n=1 Tax=Streptomyces olivoreticuli TaxID=68246 RepID=UPI001F075842|nr:DUF6087 family protein [Streptomyces olivoreticuli]